MNDTNCLFLGLGCSDPSPIHQTTSIVPVFLDNSQTGLLGYATASVHTQTALLILTRLSAFPRRFCGRSGWEKPGTTFD